VGVNTPVLMTATLSAPAIIDVHLDLTAPGAASPPTSVTIPAEATSGAFVVTTPSSSPGAPIVVTATATANGGAAKASNVYVSGATSVVISEYAGGGPAYTLPDGGNNAAADEFIELYNPTMSPVVLDGLHIQYKSATGAAYIEKLTLDAGPLPPHQYYLIGSPGYSNNPANTVSADVSYVPNFATGDFSGTAGHIRITDGGSLLDAGPTDPGVIDTLGYGSTANQAEGGAPATAPATNTTGSIERKANSDADAGTMLDGGIDEFGGHGQDTNNNAADFVVRPKRNPQNSQSPAEPPLCDGGTTSC
jgi:hypothetical protein